MSAPPLALAPPRSEAERRPTRSLQVSGDGSQDDWRQRPSRRTWLGAAWNVLSVLLVVVALADIAVRAPAIHRLAWAAAVLLAAVAALLAAVAAERHGAFQALRWHLQAVAAGVVMLVLMARGPEAAPVEPLHLVFVGAAAALFVGTAAAHRAGARWAVRSLYLALDAATVAVAVTLSALAVGGSGAAGALLGVLVGAGYAVATATRGVLRAHAANTDALLLLALCWLVVHFLGTLGQESGWNGPALLGTPGPTLLAALCLARSASAMLGAGPPPAAAPPPDNSRLRLVPAVAAGAALVQLSAAELSGSGTRVGFFGVVLLFALIVGRLVLTLVENRMLLQRVERSGVFEEKLRDLGSAVLAAPDRREALELVCVTAQQALGADSVLLWMVDSSSDELEAVEVLSPKRRSLINRRLPLDDPTSLAVRVVRTGEAEVVSHAQTATHVNGFLNVLLRSQALLAVPIARGQAVQGVLVCVQSHDPAAYGSQELAKGELLASQVAVALDNAYQHALQRRRLEELSALYQFAQSAHVALSGTEIVRQLLPIVRERLEYSVAAIWLRDGATGTLRLVVGDGAHGEHVGSRRPSRLASRAFATGQPVHVGLAWSDPDVDESPPRHGLRSQIAVPMVLKRRVVGVVDLGSPHPNAYSVGDERLLVALANHAALAVDNLHLLEETRKVATLRELDRLKTELLSTVSHELRTPLGSIKGYATTLLTHEHKLKRDERREFLEIIDSEADRLRELIENLLDMSRLEAGVLRMDRSPVHLDRVAQDVARSVQLAAPQHEVVVEWPEDAEVDADPRRIYQVMQNLLTNAVKYSPDGGRIRLAGAFDRRELTVSVADQGLGMPPGELDRVFERFHRVGGEVAQRIGGTGLGLAICKGLVDAHGGRIWAESDGEGKGSTFHFTLPLAARGHGAHHHD